MTQQSNQVLPMNLMAIAVNVVILAVLLAWGFSYVKKALKGEEVERPF